MRPPPGVPPVVWKVEDLADAVQERGAEGAAWGVAEEVAIKASELRQSDGDHSLGAVAIDLVNICPIGIHAKRHRRAERRQSGGVLLVQLGEVGVHDDLPGCLRVELSAGFVDSQQHPAAPPSGDQERFPRRHAGNLAVSDQGQHCGVTRTHQHRRQFRTKFGVSAEDAESKTGVGGRLHHRAHVWRWRIDFCRLEHANRMLFKAADDKGGEEEEQGDGENGEEGGPHAGEDTSFQLRRNGGRATLLTRKVL